MADFFANHAENADVEIIVGSYEHVLFGYKLVKEQNTAVLNLSFTDKSHCGSIRSLAVSSSGLLASGSADETIQLFDLKTRHEAGTLIKHNGTITNIAFCDEFMLSSDDAGVICIWKISGRTYECMKTLSGHKGSVESMAVHPSGKLLISVGQDKTLRTWNLITAKRAYTTSMQHVVDVLRWSPDGEKYAMCYNGKLDICLLSKAAPEHTRNLPRKGHCLAFINNNILVVGCEEGYLIFVDIAAGYVPLTTVVDCTRIKCLSVKPLKNDQSLLSFMSSDGLLELHLVDHGKTISTSLIAKTKTTLRPICVQLSVMTNKSGTEPVSLKQEVTSTKKRTKKVKGKQPKESQEVLEQGQGDQPDPEQGQSVKSSPEKTKKGKRKLVSGQDSQSPREMDKIKRVFSLRSRQSKEEEDEGKVKNPMKAVDSVKITKQKFSAKKKQRNARHHHVVETPAADP